MYIHVRSSYYINKLYLEMWFSGKWPSSAVSWIWLLVSHTIVLECIEGTLGQPKPQFGQ